MYRRTVPTALITGGTSGIGLSFARALAARGHDLVLVARDAARLDAVAADLGARYGVAIETLSADLAVRADADRVAARLGDADAPVDVLVNNAGFSVRAKLLDDAMDIHDEAAEVMMRSVLLLQGAAARAMVARGRGLIVNLASVAGFVTQGHYSAIKAYVMALTESLAVELRGSGVRVMALAPGYVRTEFHARAGIVGSSIPDPLWASADEIVEHALRDADAGRVVSIPQRRWKVIMTGLRVAPRPAVRGLSRLLSSRRSHENTPSGEEGTRHA